MEDERMIGEDKRERLKLVFYREFIRQVPFPIWNERDTWLGKSSFHLAAQEWEGRRSRYISWKIEVVLTDEKKADELIADFWSRS